MAFFSYDIKEYKRYLCSILLTYHLKFIDLFLICFENGLEGLMGLIWILNMLNEVGFDWISLLIYASFFEV